MSCIGTSSRRTCFYPISGQPAAKVSDFGIARLADVASTTPPGAVTGTPRFASPEALAGEVVGPPHDVYGLGATLYTLLSGGRPPHQVTGREPRSRRSDASRSTTRPPPVRALAPEVDSGVEDVLVQALLEDPADRPGPGKIVRALERAQARVVAAAGRRGENMNTSVSRWRVVVAGLGLAGFGLWRQFRKRRGGGGDPGR